MGKYKIFLLIVTSLSMGIVYGAAERQNFFNSSSQPSMGEEYLKRMRQASAAGGKASLQPSSLQKEQLNEEHPLYRFTMNFLSAQLDGLKLNRSAEPSDMDCGLDDIEGHLPQPSCNDDAKS